MTRITETVHEDKYSFLITSRSVLIRMRNVSEKSCRENQNTNFMLLLFFVNHAVYEIKWKHIVQPDRLQMIIRRICIAFWIPKATNTLRISNAHCFSTATMVARTRLIVTLCVLCLSCCVLIISDNKGTVSNSI
jgi:hypothetical protein